MHKHIFSPVVYSRALQVLAGEISPFMCSGSHLAQLDTFPSSVHTILEGVSKCSPSVPIRPCILKVGSLVSRDNLQPWITGLRFKIGPGCNSNWECFNEREWKVLSKDVVHYKSSPNKSSAKSLNFMHYHLYLSSCPSFKFVSCLYFGAVLFTSGICVL